MADETVRLVLELEESGATKDLGKLEKSVKSVGDTAKKTEGKLEGLRQQTRHISDDAGDADSVLQGMAGALDLVNPKLAEGARVAGDFAGGFEAIARLGGVALRVLGPIGIAVGALSLAYKKLSADLEEANNKLEEQAKRAGAAQDAMTKLRKTEELIDLELAVATGNLDPSALSGRKALDRATSIRADGRATTVVSERDRIAAQLGDARSQLAGMGPRVTVELVEQQKLVEALEGDLATANQKIAEFDKGTTNLAAKLLELEDAANKASAGTSNATKALKKLDPSVGNSTFANGATHQNGMTPAEYRAALRFENETNLDASRKAFGVVDPPTVGGSVFQATQQIGGASAGDVLGSFMANNGSAILGGLGGLAQGDALGGMTSLLSMAGPVGMGVGAGLGTLQSIGDMGAGGVRDQLEGFTDAIIAGLQELPEILGEVIPDFVGSLVSELIPALIEASPAITKALAIDLPIGIAKALVGLPVRILKGLGESIGNFGRSKAGKTIGRVAAGIGTLGISEVVRAFDVGGFVDRTGPALMHAGERVITATGAGTESTMAAARRSGGANDGSPFGGAVGAGLGAGAQVFVSGSVFGDMSGFLRQLDANVGPYGLGFSTAIGGG